MLAGLTAGGSVVGTSGGGVGGIDWGSVVLDLGKSAMDWDLQKKALKANQYNSDAYGPPVATTGTGSMMDEDWSNPSTSKLSLEKMGVIVGIVVGAIAILNFLKK